MNNKYMNQISSNLEMVRLSSNSSSTLNLFREQSNGIGRYIANPTRQFRRDGVVRKGPRIHAQHQIPQLGHKSLLHASSTTVSINPEITWNTSGSILIEFNQIEKRLSTSWMSSTYCSLPKGGYSDMNKNFPLKCSFISMPLPFNGFQRSFFTTSTLSSSTSSSSSSSNNTSSSTSSSSPSSASVLQHHHQHQHLPRNQNQNQNQNQSYCSSKSEDSSSSSTIVQTGQFLNGKPVFYVLPECKRNPEKLARYKFGQVLGEGKFAQVVEAWDISLKDQENNKVAVKIMNKNICGKNLCEKELSMLQDIKKEVSHPRLTPIKDVYEDVENLYVVLELLQGGELFEVVAREGRLNEEEAAIVLRKLMYAIEALHRAGILHRDIKLENIVLKDALEDNERDNSVDNSSFNKKTSNSDQDVNHEQDENKKKVKMECEMKKEKSKETALRNTEFKLTDFGFARHQSEGEDFFSSPAGTLGYVAPEVLKNREYTPACDVWSAGIVFYILLAGYPPFPLSDENLQRQLSANSQIEAELEAIEFGRGKTNWRAQFMEDPWPEISVEAKRLVSKMLEISPKRRATTRDVLESPFVKRYSKNRHTEYLNFE